MKLSCVQAFLCLAGMAASLPAAGAGIGQGDFELGVNVSLGTMETTVDDGLGGECTTEVDFGTVGGTVGYFLTDLVEFKVSAVAVRTGSENDCGFGGTPTQTFGIVSPGVDLVFLGRKAKASPFFGVSYGKAFGDTIGVDTDYQEGHAGVKFFIQERTTLELKVARYEPTESLASGRTDVVLGLNVYF